MAPVLVLMVGIFVVPLSVSLWMSLNSWPVLGARKFIGLDNYARMIADPLIQRSFVFTLEFAAIVTPTVFVVGLGLALLVQHNRPGIGAVRTAIFAPVAIGFAAASYLWLALSNPPTGLFDRLLVDLHISSQPINWLLAPDLAMVLVLSVTVWKSAGFAMIALMNGLHSVPTELEEAARVDGSGWLRTLWQIRLPLMKNSVAFTLTFVAIGAFLSFDQFYILTSGGPNSGTITAVYRIYNTAFTQGNLGYAAAVSIVFVILLLLITSSQLALLRRGSDV